MNPSPVTEQELQAFVDDLLTPQRRAEVEAYLRSHPADAERIRTYTEQNRILHALFDPILQEAPPPYLDPTQHPLLNPVIDSRHGAPHDAPHGTHPGQRSAANATRWRQIAAGLVLTLTGGLAGWLLHDNSSTTLIARNGAGYSGATLAGAEDNDLARHAAIAHATFSPDPRHPVEVGADQETHLVAWLSKRLGTSLHPPHLSALGFDLIGGRLLPGDDGPVAQFMYQNDAGRRMTLYVSTEQNSKHETGFRFSQEGEVSVFYWIDGKFGYALSAGLPKAELGRIADAVYKQLEQPSG